MNILICVDEKYLKISRVMLFSLRQSTKQDIHVYVFFHGKNDDEAAKFVKAMNKINIKAEIIKVDDSVTRGLKIGLHYNAAMYYRIFAHTLLPENLERVLYLDADLVIKEDIAEFYGQDFDDKYMVVCEDCNAASTWICELKKKLGLSEEHTYFNSGVLLMNLSKMRKDISRELAASTMVNMQNVIAFPDQDILNKLYENTVKYDDFNKYNMQLRKYNSASDRQLEQAYIIHFLDKYKPWLYKGIISNISHYYWRFKCRMNPIYIFEYIFTYLRGAVYEFYRKVRRHMPKFGKG